LEGGPENGDEKGTHVSASNQQIPNAAENASMVGHSKAETDLLYRDQFILSQIKDAIICTNAEGMVTFWNEGAAKVWGWSAAEMMSRSVFDRLPPGEARAWGRQRFAAVMGGEESFGERHDFRKDGSRIWVEVRSTRILDAAGRPQGVLTIARDISERRAAEEARQRDAHILAQIKDAVVCTDAGGLIHFWNEAAEKLFGWTKAEMLGQSILTQFPAEARPAIAEFRRKVLRGEVVEDREWEACRKDGGRIWISSHSQPIRDAAGQAVGIITIGCDITTHHQAVDTLRLDSQILSQIRDCVVCTDTAGNITYWNEAAVRLHGWTAEEMKGRSILELFPPESRTAAQRDLAAISEHHGFSAERLVCNQDDSRVWVQLRVTPFEGDAIRPSGFIAVARDVSERRLAEEARKLSEQQFRSAMEYSAIGMALVSVEGRWLRVNQALSSIVGYTAEELLAIDFQTITHPDDLAADLEFVQQILRGEIQTYQMEKRYFHKEGRTVWILLNVSLVRDPAGQPQYFISQIQDITLRKLAGEKLRQSEAMMAAAERLARFGSWELDLANPEVDENPLRWSDECYRIFGFEPGSVPATNEVFFSRIPADDHEAIRQAVARALAENGVYSVEHRVMLPGGAIRHVHEQARVVVNEVTGRPMKMVGTAHDITERRQVMEELVKAKESAEAAARAKSEFLAMISHEIRTPLNPILGAAQLLLGQECAPEQRELMQIIQNAGEHLLTLLSDILDLAKLESGVATLSLSPCEVSELVQGVLDIKSRDARNKNLSLGMQLDECLAFCYLLDEPRVRQILLNLVGNAVKFTSEGGITVLIERLEQGRDRDLLRFSVQDTGIGLNTEHAQHIFEPFYQVDSSATRRYEGAGLGLSICRRLVEMMGGDIGVESKLGEGSTFWFTAWMERRRSLAGSGTPWPRPLAGARRRSILLVEGDAQTRVVLTAMLERAGCDVALAETAADALELFRPGAYDMVLLNLQLPDLDGCETAISWRERERKAGIKPVPIIAQSDSADAEEVKALEQAGLNGVLVKPVRQLDLINLLNRHAPQSAPVKSDRTKRPASGISCV